MILKSATFLSFFLEYMKGFLTFSEKYDPQSGLEDVLRTLISVGCESLSRTILISTSHTMVLISYFYHVLAFSSTYMVQRSSDLMC